MKPTVSSFIRVKAEKLLANLPSKRNRYLVFYFYSQYVFSVNCNCMEREIRHWKDKNACLLSFLMEEGGVWNKIGNCLKKTPNKQGSCWREWIEKEMKTLCIFNYVMFYNMRKGFERKPTRTKVENVANSIQL